jgi:hypothetical protein
MLPKRATLESGLPESYPQEGGGLMKSRLIPILAAVLALSGCVTHHYDFVTTIDENGAVTREVEFYSVSSKKSIDADTGEEVDLELPPEAGADITELSEKKPDDTDRISRKWHSDGEIHTDFKHELQTPDLEILPYPAKESRYAFNEGEVIVHDFVLVKTITYVERFHDFFTQDEINRNLDLATDILIDVFLKTLEKDLGEEYRLDGLNTYVREEVQPLLRRWNSVILEVGQGFPVVTVGFSEEDESDESSGQGETRETQKEEWDEPSRHMVAKIMYDLLVVGIVEDLQVDLMEDDSINEDVINAIWGDIEEWADDRMSELIVSKSTGKGMAKETLEKYFAETYNESFEEQAAAMFGGEEKSDDLMGFLLGTFMFEGFPLGGHKFDLRLEMPGTLLSVFPVPENGEDVKALRSAPKTAKGHNYIRWKFSKDAFCPDGVILAATTVVPYKENQKRIFGRVVLDSEEKTAEFANKLRNSSRKRRREVKDFLGLCLKEGSQEPLLQAEKQRDADEMVYFRELMDWVDWETEDQPIESEK